MKKITDHDKQLNDNTPYCYLYKGGKSFSCYNLRLMVFYCLEITLDTPSQNLDFK